MQSLYAFAKDRQGLCNIGTKRRPQTLWCDRRVQLGHRDIECIAAPTHKSCTNSGRPANYAARYCPQPTPLSPFAGDKATGDGICRSFIARNSDEGKRSTAHQDSRAQRSRRAQTERAMIRHQTERAERAFTRLITTSLMEEGNDDDKRYLEAEEHQALKDEMSLFDGTKGYFGRPEQRSQGRHSFAANHQESLARQEENQRAILAAQEADRDERRAANGALLSALNALAAVSSPGAAAPSPSRPSASRAPVRPAARRAADFLGPLRGRRTTTMSPPGAEWVCRGHGLRAEFSLFLLVQTICWLGVRPPNGISCAWDRHEFARSPIFPR